MSTLAARGFLSKKRDDHMYVRKIIDFIIKRSNEMGRGQAKSESQMLIRLLLNSDFS